jgi:hypothetical protein
MADIKSEPWPASNRNRWPASYWNAWPASSESAFLHHLSPPREGSGGPAKGVLLCYGVGRFHHYVHDFSKDDPRGPALRQEPRWQAALSQPPHRSPGTPSLRAWRIVTDWAALFRSGGRHHLILVGGIIPLRRATSSRFGGRLRQESASEQMGRLRSNQDPDIGQAPSYQLAGPVERGRRTLDVLDELLNCCT